MSTWLNKATFNRSFVVLVFELNGLESGWEKMSMGTEHSEAGPLRF